MDEMEAKYNKRPKAIDGKDLSEDEISERRDASKEFSDKLARIVEENRLLETEVLEGPLEKYFDEEGHLKSDALISALTEIKPYYTKKSELVSDIKNLKKEITESNIKGLGSINISSSDRQDRIIADMLDLFTSAMKGIESKLKSEGLAPDEKKHVQMFFSDVSKELNDFSAIYGNENFFINKMKKFGIALGNEETGELGEIDKLKIGAEMAVNPRQFLKSRMEKPFEKALEQSFQDADYSDPELKKFILSSFDKHLYEAPEKMINEGWTSDKAVDWLKNQAIVDSQENEIQTDPEKFSKVVENTFSGEFKDIITPFLNKLKENALFIEDIELNQ